MLPLFAMLPLLLFLRPRLSIFRFFPFFFHGFRFDLPLPCFDAALMPLFITMY